METKTVPALAFGSFAATSLTRWRALAGQSVSPCNPRWGQGRVVDLRWEGRSDRPDDEGRIYVRVEYQSGLRARVDTRAFARLHSDVTVEATLADFVATTYTGPLLPGRDAARSAELARWDRALQATWDDERRLRAAELQRRAREREEEEPSVSR